MREIKKNVPN